MVNEKCRVVEHRELGSGYRHIVLSAPAIAEAAAPGQFVHVRVPALEASALRRPFSIFNAEDGRIELIYKTVGRGTAALRAVAPGDDIEMLGPLGHGFPTKCAGEALLVGGGYGVAPLYFLARRLLAADEGRPSVMLFVGGRTAADLLAVDRFKALGRVEIRLATNDGSAGVKGLVTDPLDDELIRLRGAGAEFELFACGPDPMLKAVALRATGTGAKGWISMDRHMVCGVGACYACIQKTVRGNSRCCIEGPVFAAADLVW
ncbi:MAG: dihydroorotate dehydrogenase electron transfer subunit [Kiritimatiellae bacterium]|nr:dihydroorotate dehydrogenase electron transfer subunit [Kiritimatiellia bacterium]